MRHTYIFNENIRREIERCLFLGGFAVLLLNLYDNDIKFDKKKKKNKKPCTILKPIVLFCFYFKSPLINLQ